MEKESELKLEFPEIEMAEAVIKKTMFAEDGTTYEVEEIIMMPVFGNLEEDIDNTVEVDDDVIEKSKEEIEVGLGQ